MFHPQNGRQGFADAAAAATVPLAQLRLGLTPLLRATILERYQELNGDRERLKEEFDLSDELIKEVCKIEGTHAIVLL